MNYIWSRLYGNYSGTASSDEEGVRSDVNVNRYFDLPIAGFSASGGPDNGPLATDRPHVFKAFGSYSLNWGKSNSGRITRPTLTSLRQHKAAPLLLHL